VSPALRDLVHQLLQKDPSKRLASASDAIAHLREPARQAAEVPARSIAVLYFENMSSERESDYFCAGITEDIITDLSKVRDLHVVSRTDMLPFRNKEINIRQVADALRVNYVLEGSVRKAGNRIRVTAQFINARNGYHLWADRFDGLIEDIFDLQDEVARKITDALKISLTDAEQKSLAKKPTDDLRAYDFYMRGRDYLNRRGKKNTEMAIRMFENALEIDAEFVGAYAGLGEACSYMYEWYDTSTDWLARAIEMNTQALEREPASVEAKFGIAMVYYHQQRYTEARRRFTEVAQADPKHVHARLRLGMLAERMAGGDLGEALSQYRRASELKPSDDDPWRCLAALYRRLGDLEASNDAALKVIEIVARKLEASLEDVVLLSRMAEAYARVGGREETRAVLRRILEIDPSDGLVFYNCACAHALLGDAAPALVFLRRAVDSGFRAVVRSATADSTFDSIVGDPAFQSLIAELES
jgi:adenylate cyclase